MNPVRLPDPPPAPTKAAATRPPAHPDLLQLGRWLQTQHYVFACPTPETQRLVEQREPAREARQLHDVFGWNRPFTPELLPGGVLQWMRDADVLDACDGRLRCRVRFSTIGGRLFLHSGYPTQEHDAVFLGPDTHRFAAFVQAALAEGWRYPVRRAVDIGCGSGAGAIVAADLLDPRVLDHWLLRDINPRALSYAATNVALNETPQVVLDAGDALRGVDGTFDLVIANPPYMIDGAQRLYRDGGGPQGVTLALRFLHDALQRLAPGGRILLYTGTPVIEGEDQFWRHAAPLLQAAQVRFNYRELDPDVHGQNLALPAYAQVERIAAVGLCAARPGAEH